MNSIRNRSFLTAAVCLFLAAMSGCQQGWVSRESAQGKELEKLSLGKVVVNVNAQEGWPLRFEPVAIQKQFSDRSGTQFRAVVLWNLSGKPADIQPLFARLLNDTSNRRIELLVLRLTYHDQEGRPVGSDVIHVNPNLYGETIALPSFGKQGSPRSVTVTLESAVWSEATAAADAVKTE
jgi:hypothetical protein